jgi:hypothetical protein
LNLLRQPHDRRPLLHQQSSLLNGQERVYHKVGTFSESQINLGAVSHPRSALVPILIETQRPKLKNWAGISNSPGLLRFCSTFLRRSASSKNG